MDHWIGAHVDRHRKEMHAEAARTRMLRRRERSSLGLRGRIADGAESASNALAQFARRLRTS